MRNQRPETLATYFLLALASAVSFVLPSDLLLNSASAQAGPDSYPLTGTVRDFKDGHPDFGITNVADMGHSVHNVANNLGSDGRPMYTGGGNFVVTEWKDKDGRTIMPYNDVDPGLPGGHLDVDVYDKATDKKLYHKHEFDDAYNTTFIDVANDIKLLFRKVVPVTYQDLKLVFVNAASGGGGTFQFQAGGPLLGGMTSSGFTTTFTPSKLTVLRVNFASLLALRQTNPTLAQKNVATRDGAFAIRMYDAVSNVLKYEIVVYNHVKDVDIIPVPPAAPAILDSCGKPIVDSFGALGFSTDGAVTSLTSFDSWFHNRIGTNLSAPHTIELVRNNAGVYEYLDNKFFPADGNLYGNEYADHNYFFSYNVVATFTYDACMGQFFEFEGNDDAWLFINNRLVMDLGGVVSSSRQYVALDRLNLVDGQMYSLNFFYANRRTTPVSIFNMRTNLVLTTDYAGSVSAGVD